MPFGSLRPVLLLLGLLLAAGVQAPSAAAEDPPLRQIIDAQVKAVAGNLPLAPVADDAAFFRRIHLDFSGAIPHASDVRAFLENPAPDKRERVIEQLLEDEAFAEQMAHWFHIHLMERRGENAHWHEWLREAFNENRPWDEMARQLIRADFRDEANRGAAFFYTKRLEKVGQQPTDYPGLTRDMGRLFLGMDLQCAECHNHLQVKDYDQVDFQGLFAAFSNVKRLNLDYPAIEEGLIREEMEYASVFTGRKRTTAPRVPGLEEVAIPIFEEGEEYEVVPDKKAKTPGVPKFSALERFAEQIPQSPNFARNIANRLWFMMMGRGLYEPLDLYHTANPPSHPELLEQMAISMRDGDYDIKALLGEIAQSESYQRSSRLPQGMEASQLPLDRFLVARQRRLSAEQLLASTVRACGLESGEVHSSGRANESNDQREDERVALEERFRRALGNDAKIPEREFSPSLKGALFMMNDPEIQSLIAAGATSFANRAEAMALSPAQMAEELYLQVLSRLPTPEEQTMVAEQLEATGSDDRATALRSLMWAMLSSTEFVVNH